MSLFPREETEANHTAPAVSPPKEPSTTTTSTTSTLKPEPPTTSSTTTEQPKPTEPEPRIEDNNVEPPTYNIVYPNTEENVFPKESDIYITKPKFEPRPTSPQPTPSEQPPLTTPTELPSPTPQPEVTFNRPTPPEYIPEAELPKQPVDLLPGPTYPPRPEEPTNESIPPEEEPNQPETTLIPQPLPTEQPKPTPPIYQVNVNVGRETATVAGERKDDGSVVVDTQELPKNEWTKINIKPKDCPFGFEADEYGACFGKIHVLFSQLSIDFQIIGLKTFSS